MNRLCLFFLFLLVASGCAHRADYGVEKNGNVYYPLCEKAKQRVQDMQRVSFELPEVFKHVPCDDSWPGYIYDVRSNSLNVESLGEVHNGELLRGYSVEVQAGFGRAELFLPPEDLFEERVDYLTNYDRSSRLVGASWVAWSLGRCARFYSDADSGSSIFRKFEYYCWESLGGSPYSIYLYASERVSKGDAGTDLDKVLIWPLLTSMQIKPVSPLLLEKWDASKVDFCQKLKFKYDNKLSAGFSDALDQTRMRVFLRGCGYKIPDPVKVVAGLKRWDELFRPDGRLLGEQAGNDSTLRVLTKSEFDVLEKKLLALRVKPSKRPEARYMKLSKGGNFTVEAFKMTGEYPGVWYQVPPYYSDGTGFGIREDKDIGRVIDIYKLSSHIPFGFRFVSE